MNRNKSKQIVLNCFHSKFILHRSESTTAATSKMEYFVIIVNGWKPLTIITKSSILNLVAVLDPLLLNSFCCYSGHFLTSFSSALRNCPNNIAILSYDVITSRYSKYSIYKKYSTHQKIPPFKQHSLNL